MEALLQCVIDSKAAGFARDELKTASILFIEVFYDRGRRRRPTEPGRLNSYKFQYAIAPVSGKNMAVGGS